MAESVENGLVDVVSARSRFGIDQRGGRRGISGLTAGARGVQVSPREPDPPQTSDAESRPSRDDSVELDADTAMHGKAVNPCTTPNRVTHSGRPGRAKQLSGSHRRSATPQEPTP